MGGTWRETEGPVRLVGVLATRGRHLPLLQAMCCPGLVRDAGFVADWSRLEILLELQCE